MVSGTGSMLGVRVTLEVEALDMSDNQRHVVIWVETLLAGRTLDLRQAHLDLHAKASIGMHFGISTGIPYAKEIDPHIEQQSDRAADHRSLDPDILQVLPDLHLPFPPD